MGDVLKLPTAAEVAEVEGRSKGAIRRQAEQEERFWRQMASRREVGEMVKQGVNQAMQRVGQDMARLVVEVSAMQQLMLDDGLLTPERLQRYRRVAGGVLQGMTIEDARVAAEQPETPPADEAEPEGDGAS